MKAVEAVDGALSDAVVCGLNQDCIALLGFLNEKYCRQLAGGDLTPDELATNPEVLGAVRKGLERYNLANPNAAKRISRILLEAEPPLPDAGEITEKGYINQGKVQALRARSVERLFASTPDNQVLVL